MTQSQTNPHWKQIDSEVRNPIRSAAVVQHYTSSQSIVQPAPPTAGEIPGIVYDVPEIPEIEFPESSLVTSIQPGPSMESNASTRKRSQELNFAGPSGQAKCLRREKKCWKCFSSNCPGAVSKKSCKSPCTSCGDMSCKGKDSQHPGQKCEKLSKLGS